MVFRLKRTSAAKDKRYAVALLVNGENTLYRERFRADYRTYRKWVLEPAAGPMTIDGFQKDEGDAGQFAIESSKESKEDEINYGDNVGKITLVVFPEKQSGETIATDPKDVSTTRGLSPEIWQGANTLEALQNRLRHTSGFQGRGLIKEGTDLTKSPVKEVDFEAAAEPIMSVTITYYHRQ